MNNEFKMNVGNPVQLIRIKEGKFVVSHEASQIIRKLDGQIGIITIVVSQYNIFLPYPLKKDQC